MTEHNHATLQKIKRDLQEKRSTKYKTDSKDRLKKIAGKKIKTTMIGALDAVEKHFGFLWEDNSDVSSQMREIYDTVREEILDNGNNQIRNLNEEFEHYSIEWLRYKLTIPIIQKETQDG